MSYAVKMMDINVIYISGSPRENSNTDYLLRITQSITGGTFIKLSKHHIGYWSENIVEDDMDKTIIPLILQADSIVLGSPVYFNNVSAQMKTFMDRMGPLHGKMERLRNKIGGAIVVGRRDGVEGAITAINAFFLKHEMIPANRGVCGFAWEEGEIKQDIEAIESAKKLGHRIIALVELTKRES